MKTQLGFGFRTVNLFKMSVFLYYGVYLYMNLTAKDIMRFNQQSLKSTSDQCWKWLGKVDKQGYARFSVGQSNFLAHKISYLLTYKIWAEPKLYRTCGNRQCINPKHLSLVKSGKPKGRHPKLSKKDRLLIIDLFQQGWKNKDLAKKFKVSPGLISQVLHPS